MFFIFCDAECGFRLKNIKLNEPGMKETFLTSKFSLHIYYLLRAR